MTKTGFGKSKMLILKALLILSISLSSCKSDFFNVQSISFSNPIKDIMLLYIDEHKQKLNPAEYVIYVNVTQRGEDSIRFRINNNWIAKGDFENCEKKYNYITFFEGYKVYVFGDGKGLYTVNDDDFLREKVPDNCYEHVPVTYEGNVWEITIVNGKVVGFDFMFTVPSKKTKEHIIGKEINVSLH